MNNNYKISEDVMVEFNEVEVGCEERGRSIIEFYDEFGYDSEGGKLIKKYGSEVIRDEFIKKVKEYCEENDEEYYEINWG